MMLGSKASWVETEIGPEDQQFDQYADVTLEQWHRQKGLWLG